MPLFSSSQKLPTIEEKTKDLKKYEGYFNFYWDENAGKIWLEIDKLDTEIFIQFLCLPDWAPMILVWIGDY